MINLTSPNYPDMYPSMLSSSVNISTEPGNILVIEWLQFHLEQDKNCSFDKLIISEQVGIENNKLNVISYEIFMILPWNYSKAFIFFEIFPHFLKPLKLFESFSWWKVSWHYWFRLKKRRQRQQFCVEINLRKEWKLLVTDDTFDSWCNTN